MTNIANLTLEQFQKLPIDNKLDLAKNDFKLFLTMNAREDETNFLRNVKEITKCSDYDAQKLLNQAKSGEYSGFDPELKAMSEKAARFVATHEAGKKLVEWVKEENVEDQKGHLIRGSLVGLSHDKQVHALADHYAHGGSIADAARAMGMSEEQAKKVEKAEKEYKEKYDQDHKDELERINGIKDEAQRKKALDEYNRAKLNATNDELYRQGLISAQMHRKNQEASKIQAAKTTNNYNDGQNLDRNNILNKAPISDKEKIAINDDLIEIKRKIDKGTALPKDEAKWHIATLTQMPKERQAEYLESNPKVKGLIERYSVKNDDKTLNYLANSFEVSKDAKSAVKCGEQESGKKVAVLESKKLDDIDDFGSSNPAPPINKSFIASKRNEGEDSPSQKSTPSIA